MAKVEDIEIQFLPKGVRSLVRDFDNLTDKEKELLSLLGDTNKKLKETNNIGQKLSKTLVTAFATTQLVEYAREVGQLVISVTEFNRKLSQTTGLSGKELDSLSAKTRGLARTFGKDQDELTQRINQFAKQSKISYGEAFDLVKVGFREGADNGGKFLDLLEEYPVQFKKAGLSAQGFIQFALQTVRGGSLADKLPDTIKEAANLRLGEQTKAVKDALAPLGTKFRDEVLKGVENKTITKFDGFKKILKRAKQLNLTTSQTQKIIADLGGGALEDLGGLDVALQNINEAQKINLDATSAASKEIEKRIELDRELAELQGELAAELKGVAKDSQELYKRVQILVLEGLLEFVKIMKAAPRFIKENRDMLILFGVSLVALNANFLASKIQIIAYSAAQKTATLSTNLFTKASNGLKNALRTNPFGFVLGAATALAGAYKLLTRSSSRFEKIQKKITKAGDEATKGLRKENAEFNLKINRLKKLNPSSKERKRLIEEINTKYKDYLPSLLTEKSSLNDIERAQKRVNDGYRTKIKILSKNKQVELITEELAKLENANAKLNEEFSNQKPRNALQELGRLLSKGEQSLQKEIDKNDKLIEKLKKRSEDLFKEIDEINEKVAEANRKSEPSKPKPKKQATGGFDPAILKAAQKLAQEKLKLEKASAAELEKLRLERRIRESEDAQKNEDDFKIKKKLIEQEKMLRIELAQLEKNESLKAAKTKSQRLVAEEKFAAKKVEIEKASQEKLKAIRLEALQNGKKIATARRALERNSKKAANLELDRLEFEALQELRVRYREGKIKFEEFQSEKAQIAYKFRKKRLDAEILFLQNTLATENLGVAKRLNAEQALFDRKKELANLELENHFRLEAEKTKTTKGEAKNREEIIAASFEFSKTFVQSVADFQKAARDEELQDLRLQKEAELAAAGENATARERIEEKFRKKEQELAIKQAKADKTASLFQIAIQTAENIVRVAAKPALIPFVVATGLFQAGVVARQPLPKFHQGKEAEMTTRSNNEIDSTILKSEKVIAPEASQNLLRSGWTNQKLAELGQSGITPTEVLYPRYELLQIPFVSPGGGISSEQLAEIRNRQDFIEQKIEDLAKGFHVTIGARGGDFAAYVNDQVEQQNITQERRGY